MTVQRQIDQLIAHRASEWIDILKTGRQQDREAFVDWLRESRKHVSEFLAMVALDRELKESVFGDLVDREALLTRVSPRLSGLPSETLNGVRRPPIITSVRSAGWLMRAALAAGIGTIALGLIWMLGSFPPSQEFKTGTGEQRAIELADGSVAVLNAESRVRASLTSSARDVQLLEGEALFKVARDPRRPFRVYTRDAIVQAVGTQFNVNARHSGTVVSVLEGKVQVSTHNAQANQVSGAEPPVAFVGGEVAHVEANGKIHRQSPANVTDAAAWRQRRLVFRGTPIGEIVREFNQHNASPKLRLENIEAHSRHYSATFDADDPGSYVDFLNREQDLTIEKRGEELIIRPR